MMIITFFNLPLYVISCVLCGDRKGGGGDVDHFKLNHNNEKQMKKCSAILPLHFSD